VSSSSLFIDCDSLGVSISPSRGNFEVGDVLTCTSLSTFSTYSFTDILYDEVTDGDTVRLREKGRFRFRCTATVALDTATECTGTDTVRGTVVGKKHQLLLSKRLKTTL